MLRAGPFSDERVIRLINRRFVPVYFDLNPGGALADPKARQFTVKAKPELGMGSVDTPPVLVATPSGKVLAEVSNYADEGTMLRSLRDVLTANDEWNRMSDEEKKLASVGTVAERALLLYDLGHVDAARRMLEEDASPDSARLLARICRLAGDWDALELALVRWKNGGDDAFVDDAHIERAWLARARHDYAAAAQELGGVPKESGRYTEARYLAGLLLWHQGQKEEALAAWKATIEKCGQDPWIYRADWAFTQVMGGDRTEFSTAGERCSPLGRIGYMGRRNPDLDPP